MYFSEENRVVGISQKLTSSRFRELIKFYYLLPAEMAVALSFEDAVRALFGVGSRSDRPPVPRLIGAKDGGASQLDEILGAFPALRTDVWSAIASGLDSAVVAGKHARRAGGEISYGLEVAAALVAQPKLATLPCLLAHLSSWAWCVPSLIAQLCGSIAGPSAPQTLSPSAIESRLPRLLQSSTTILSDGWEGPAGGGGADGDDEDDGGSSGPSRRRAGVAAKVLSRVEDVGPLAGAAMRLLTSSHPGVTLALRAANSGACPLTAVAAACLRALQGLVQGHSNPKKVFTLLLSLEGAGRPVALPAVRNEEEEEDNDDDDDGMGGAVTPAASKRDSLLSLLLTVRDGAVASLAILSPTYSSSATRRSQLSHLTSAAEALAERVLFATSDITLGYDNACPAALALAQRATVAYAAVRQAQATAEADAEAVAAAPAAVADKDGSSEVVLRPGGSTAAAAAAVADADLAPPKKKKMKPAPGSSSGSNGSSSSTTTVKLFVPPRLNAERRLFEELRRHSSISLNSNSSGSGDNNSSSNSSGASGGREEAVLRSLPFLFASYLRRSRAARAEAAAMGTLDVNGKAANAAATAAANEEGEGSGNAASNNKRKRGREAESSKDGGVSSDATAAVTSLIRSPGFAVFAELLALAIGAPSSGDGSFSFDIGLAKAAATSPSSACVLASQAVAGSAASDLGGDDSALLLLPHRLRSAAGLLTVALQCGLYSVNDDVSPHPQSAVLWALAGWAENAFGATLTARASPASRAAVIRGLCGLHCALLEANHALLPSPEDSVEALFAAGAALVTSYSRQNGSNSGVSGSVVSSLCLLLCQLTTTYAQLRRVGSLIALLSRLAGKMAATSAGASLLFSVLSHPSLTACLTSAFTDLPIGQVADTGAALAQATRGACVAATSAARAEVAAAGGVAGLNARRAAASNRGKFLDSDDEEDSEEDSGDDHDDDASSSTALPACVVASALCTLTSLFLRQLAVTSPSSLKAVHLAVSVTYGCVRPLLETACSGAGPDVTWQPHLLDGACGLLTAATDLIVRCAPYEPVRRHVPSLIATGTAGSGCGGGNALLHPLWPVSAYVAAAEAVGPLPPGIDTSVTSSSSSSAKPLSGMAALLSSAYGSSKKAADVSSGSSNSGGLPSIVEVCTLALTQSRSLRVSAAAAGACLAESRLRLLHACVRDPASTPSPEATSAARSLAHLTLSPPALASGVSASTIDVAAAWASDAAVKAFVRAMLTEGRQFSDPDATGWPERLLADAQLYELQPVVAHIASEMEAALRAGPLTLLASALQGSASGISNSKKGNTPSKSCKEAPSASSDVSAIVTSMETVAKGDISALPAALAAVASLPASASGSSAIVTNAVSHTLSFLSVTSSLPRCVLVSHSYAHGSSSSGSEGDLTSGPALHPSAVPLVAGALLAQAVLSKVVDVSASQSALTSVLQILAEVADHPSFASALLTEQYSPLVGLIEGYASAEGGGQIGACGVLQRLYVALGHQQLRQQQQASGSDLSSASSSGSNKKKEKKQKDKASASESSEPAFLLAAPGSSPRVTACRARAVSTLLQQYGNASGDGKQPPAVLSCAAEALLQALSDGSDEAASLDTAGAALRLAPYQQQAFASKSSAGAKLVRSAVKGLTSASPGLIAFLADLASCLTQVRAAEKLSAGNSSIDDDSSASSLYRRLVKMLVTPQLVIVAMAAVADDSSNSSATSPLGSLLGHLRLIDLAALAQAVKAALTSATSFSLAAASAVLAGCHILLQVAAQALEEAAVAAAAAASAVGKASVKEGGHEDDGAEAQQVSSSDKPVILDGGYALRDAMTSFVRHLLPTVTSLASSPATPLPLVAPSLHLLRSVVGLARLTQGLRREELYACLGALTSLTAQAASPAVRAARLALAASRGAASSSSSFSSSSVAVQAAEREVKQLAVDLGRSASADGGISDGLIVTCAPAAFPPVPAPSASSAAMTAQPSTASSSSSSLRFGSAELAGAAWVLQSFCRYRPEAALDSAPLVTQLLQGALVLALTPLPAAPGRTPAGYASAAALTALSRACEAYARLLKVARYHAAAVLGTYVQLAAAGRGVTSGAGDDDVSVGTGLPTSVRSCIEPSGIMALVDTLASSSSSSAGGSGKELQQLYTQLSSAPLARATLKALHRTYEAEVRYTGKA